MDQSIVHAVEDDEDAPQLRGVEERHGLLKEGVSAVQQGDGGHVHRTQFSQTAACRLCDRRFQFDEVNIKTISNSGLP